MLVKENGSILYKNNQIDRVFGLGNIIKKES